MNTQKVLVIAYSLSEASLAGSYRVRRFCKYLSRSGAVQVEVITAEVNSSDDVALGCKVLHVSDGSRTSLAARLVTRAFGLPDPFVFWSLRVISCLRQLAKHASYDVVLVSGPPHSLHLVGLYAKRRFKARYIADFRDGFVDNHRHRWLTPVHKLAARLLESRIVQEAACLISNTRTLESSLRARYGQDASIQTITNGYDDTEKVATRHFSRSTVVFVGGVYGGLAPEVMADIAGSIQRRGLEFDVCTAGPGDWTLSERYANWTHLGLISNAEADAVVQASSVAILLMPQGEREPSPTIPLKTFQYLNSPARIVYVGERGEVWSLLEQFEGTTCFSRASYSEAIECVVDRLDAADPGIVRDVREFHFKELSAKLLDVIQNGLARG